MKKLSTAALLFALVFLSAFRPDETPSFSATIDSKPFKLREDQLFRGIVANKNGSIDGRVPNRTVVSVTFNGPAYNASEGRLFNENLQFEINYEADKTGEPQTFMVAMQYESANYYNVKDQSKLTVTQFEWESDKKHFLISADYNCKMRSWGAPADGKKDLILKGRMSNIRVTVPSWVTAKN